MVDHMAPTHAGLRSAPFRTTFGRLVDNRGAILLIAPLALYLLVFYILPLLGVLRLSMFSPEFTMEHYAGLWRHPVYAKVILNTLNISFCATVACMLIGYPLAYGMTFLGPVWRMALLAAVTIPFWISVLVRTYSWMIILGRNGAVNMFLQWLGITDQPLELMYNRLGLTISLTYVLLPYAVLPLHSVMSGIDRELIRAAGSLGSSPWQAFRRVCLPLSFPGVAAGFLLSFIVGVGTFVTPSLTGGRTDVVVAMSINSQLEIVNDWAFAGVLSVMLFLAVLFLLTLCLRFVGLELLFGSNSGDLRQKRTRRRGLSQRLETFAQGRLLDSIEAYRTCAARLISRTLGILVPVVPGVLRKLPWGVTALRGFCCLAALYLIFPLGIIMPIAFSDDTVLRFPPQAMGLGLFDTFFSSGAWMRAATNSLRVAAPVMVLATVLGTLGAMGIRRCKGATRQAMYGLFISPLIIPAIINAVAIYFFMAKIQLIGTIPGLVLAHTVAAIPFVIIVMNTTLQGVDTSLEQASNSLGADKFRTFFHVTLPLIRPGLFTAMIFAFIASLDELIITLFISGARSITLPRQMWDGIRDAMDPVIAAVAALFILVALAATLTAGLIRRHLKQRQQS